MPTCKGREHMLQLGIEYYHKQDYPNKELIIIGDELGKSIGEKRNYGCRIATGDLICHFDDDDFYKPDYLSKAAKHMFETGAQMTGLSSAYFYQPGTGLWLYEYKGRQPYVIGSGMMYYRTVWERKPFEDRNEGEDLLFQTNAGRIIPHGYLDSMVAIIHGGNTASHKQLAHMQRLPLEKIQEVMGDTIMKYDV